MEQATYINNNTNDRDCETLRDFDMQGIEDKIEDTIDWSLRYTQQQIQLGFLEQWRKRKATDVEEVVVVGL